MASEHMRHLADCKIGEDSGVNADDPTRTIFDWLAQASPVQPQALRSLPEGHSGDRSARRTAAASRQNLFSRQAATPGGVAYLVRMRDHILQRLADHPGWVTVEADLSRVLKARFNPGLLEFRRLDERSPAPLLEKLIRYEAVHKIHAPRELRRRLEADRRCYGFFHPAWPDEPLVFTELALTRGMSASIGPLLDPDSPVHASASCDTAIFYSITNCHPGLRGFALGSSLLGRSIEVLRSHLPGLRTFATLSPIPGFRPWLSTLAESRPTVRKTADLLEKLDLPGWFEDAAISSELEAALVPLCALYLLRAKSGDEPADPVARFHLANGARLQRINWLSDMSPEGLRRSAGLTASYVYQPLDLERNRSSYARDREVHATSHLERLSKRGAALNHEPGIRLPIPA
jgi:malonyl-CoA decarboxylase